MPGPTERLRERTYRIDLGIIDKIKRLVEISLNREVGHGKEAALRAGCAFFKWEFRNMFAYGSSTCAWQGKKTMRGKRRFLKFMLNFPFILICMTTGAFWNYLYCGRSADTNWLGEDWNTSSLKHVNLLHSTSLCEFGTRSFASATEKRSSLWN
ncbi:hypothetical protein BD779DRAFT_1520657 [Infundibulicybe gibba]|nr:hypothetical protein BD779DRAFT_1520657 [Infundibulicybe gibba]